MSNAEIKERIHKAVDLAPESTLEEILNFVETKQGYFDEKKLDEAFERVLVEDREVLQRLAK